MLTLFLPRGIRNNNPGNIRLSRSEWKGQRQTQLSDKEFVEFISPIYGIRALMKLLLTYHLKYGLNTVESILNRYAPPHENATDNYIHQVCKALKVKRREPIALTNQKRLIQISQAIVLHENGKAPPDMPLHWFDENTYQQAAEMAMPETV